MKRLNLNKVQTARAVGIVLLALMVLASYLLIIGPRLSKAAEVRANVAAAKMANQGARNQIATLKQSAANIGEALPIAGRLAALFPPDADQKQLFRQIKSAGAVSGIKDFELESVQPGAPAFGVVNSSGGATAAAAPTAPAAGGKPSVAGSPSSIASQSLHITGKASRANFLAFLGNLQGLDRSFLISSVKFTEAEKGDGSIDVSGLMFMLPKPINPNDPKVELPKDVPAIPGAGSAAEDPNATQEEKDLSGGLVKVKKPKS